jgi:hypothetical protein
LKMELTEGSETSASHNLSPGKYPKEHIQQGLLYQYFYIIEYNMDYQSVGY